MKEQAHSHGTPVQAGSPSEHSYANPAHRFPPVNVLHRESPPQPSPSATPEVHPAVTQSLRSIKLGLLVLLALCAVIVGFFIWQTSRQAGSPAPSPSPTATQPTGNQIGTGGPSAISCLSQTGPDVTTTSQSFVDMEGTECIYQTGPTEETLVLNGKLTGRNTEGTGMSVTLSVNGKECNGGETLNYSRTYTPMTSSCVFVVPANTSVGIKWRFLSPFGGTAAILRSNKNIAPFITGTALPKTDRP